jgi:hypothetical protein
MMKHTPGPHTVEAAEHLGDPAYAIRAADGDLIAVGMLKGDADLFAAAPDLLTALQTAVSLYGDGFANDVRELCRAAIAAAGEG